MMQSDCVMGVTQLYLRRNPCSKCRNKNSEYVSDPYQCVCSNQDFRCSEGLHRPINIDAAGNIECVLDNDAELPSCSHKGMIVPYV